MKQDKWIEKLVEGKKRKSNVALMFCPKCSKLVMFEITKGLAGDEVMIEPHKIYELFLKGYCTWCNIAFTIKASKLVAKYPLNT